MSTTTSVFMEKYENTDTSWLKKATFIEYEICVYFFFFVLLFYYFLNDGNSGFPLE